MTVRRDTVEILDRCIESLESIASPLNYSKKVCEGCQREDANDEFQWRAYERTTKAVERLERLREYFREEVA